MDIRVAGKSDAETIFTHDAHIRKEELETIVSLERVIIAEEKGIFMGWGNAKWCEIGVLQKGMVLLQNVK